MTFDMESFERNNFAELKISLINCVCFGVFISFDWFFNIRKERL